MASGVLVLCLGVATRLVEYYQGHDKVYLARVTLGEETDTCDAMGAVVESAPVPSLDRQTVEEMLAQFVGTIDQVPPIFSALKQDGESLHRKARRGETVTVEARPVTIHSIDLIDFSAPDQIAIRVHCSAGTYIRSLARDIGRALGTVAHLSKLRREQVGAFTLEDAHSLAEIEAAADAGKLPALLLPVGAGLDLPKIVLAGDTVKRLGYGQKVPIPVPKELAHVLNAGDIAQGVTVQGQLIGILRVLQPSNGQQEPLLVKAEKWFAEQLNVLP
jgi:tRNA pseudouridine55 synthase